MNLKELKKEIFELCMHRTELGKEATKDILLRLGYSFATTNIFKESQTVQEHHVKISDSVNYFLKHRDGYVADTLYVLIEAAAKNNPVLLAGLFGFVEKSKGEYVCARPVNNFELMT